jgi:hypothetical protein
MSLAAPFDLNDWFEEDIERFIILTPTSTSPQPVHVLNGFFHNSLTGRRAPKAAVDFVATKAGGEWAIGTSQLRQKSPLELPSDDFKLEKARRAVGALIGADRAVFASFASFQLAFLGLITSDRTHHHLGELAARLALRSPDGVEALKTVLQRLGQPQPNPHWAVEAVLSEPDVLADVDVQLPSEADWWATDERCRHLADELSAVLVRALQLAAGSVDSLLALEVLAVTATWVGLIVYAQVPSLCLANELEPLLCEVGEPGSLSSIRLASAATIDRLDAAFQQWMSQRILLELKRRFGNSVPDEAEAIEYVREAKVKKLAGGSTLTASQIEEIYRAWRQDHDAADALAFTLQEALTAAMGNKARDWFAAVGRHCGFVGPRRGHPARLRVEVTLAPTLLLAGFADGDGEAITYDEWASRLAARFGVVLGPCPQSRAMVPRASEEELERNRSEMCSLFTSLGLARRYSDGVTELLNPFSLWRLDER